jgi:acetylornithine/succinyldiaminopimelate/putrescine aminotransferase
MKSFSVKSILQSNLAPTSDGPLDLPLVRAKGIHVYDNTGKAYIDLISGISVNNVGHNHPDVVRAIRRQLHHHSHLMVYGEYGIPIQQQLAEKLNSVTPDHINSFYLVNSGSEAVEGALKLAKKVTGRSEIVAFRNAYHGSTHGALSLMDNEYFSLPFGPLLPQITFADFNSVDSLDLISERTAAVVMETVQGEAGYLPAKPEFIRKLREKCDSTGALWIADEIQSGFGRTGKFWAFEHYDVAPDILLMAKGMGGGMPIGCFAASKELMNVLATKPILGHITTFGGHPVSCAASSATIDVIQSEKVLPAIDRKADLLRNSLPHPKIKSISGKGFMLAIELDDFETVEKTMKLCLEEGLIIDWFLYAQNKLRIAPPLTMNTAQVKKVVRILHKALDQI